MAGGMDLGGGTKGGKKPLDAALNMVPFIDLMAVTIVFFIQAGTWTQLGSLQVSTSGASTTSDSADPPPLPVSLLVTEKSLRLTVGTTTLDPMPVTRNAKGSLDLAPLKLALATVKRDNPDLATSPSRPKTVLSTTTWCGSSTNAWAPNFQTCRSWAPRRIDD